MRWRRWIWPGFLSLLGLALALVPLSEGRFFFYSDNAAQHFPAVSFLVESLRRGEFPTWWPQVMAGFPIVAEGQAGHFHPVHVALAALLPAPAAFMVEIGLTFAVAALGVYAFLRLFRLHPAICATGAIMHAFSSMALVMVLNAVTSRSSCLFGFVMYFAERYARERRTRDGAALALVIGLQLLGGYPTPALISAGAAGLHVVLRAIQLGRRGRTMKPAPRAVMTAAGLVFFIVLGGGVAAIQLLPTARHVPESIRATGLSPGLAAAELASKPSLWLQWTMPYAVHPMRQSSDRDVPIGRAVSWFYMGALAPLLTIAAFWWWRRWTHPLWAFALGAVLSTALAVGDLTPLFPALIRLPVLDSFRYPSRILLWTSFCCACVAAFGLQHLLDWSRKRRALPWAVPGAWLALIGASAAVSFAVNVGVKAIGISLVLTVVALAATLLLARSRDRWRGIMLTAIAVFATIDLGLLSTESGYPRSVPIADALAPTPITAWLQKDPEQFRILAFLPRTTSVPIPPGLAFGMLAGPAGTLFGLEGLRTNFSLPPSRSLLAGEAIEQWITAHPGELDRVSKLLGALNVKYVIGWSDVPVAGWPLAVNTGSVSAWQNPAFLPRAFLVGHAVAAPALDPDTRAAIASRARGELGWLKDPDFFLGDVAIVERTLKSRVDIATTAMIEGPGVPALAGLGALHSVEEIARPAGQLAYIVETDRPALLYISTMTGPGWRATVNGAAATIYRANWMGTAVEVPAGKSQVELAYELPGIRIGALVSAFSLLLAVALGLGSGVLRRRRMPIRT